MLDISKLISISESAGAAVQIQEPIIINDEYHDYTISETSLMTENSLLKCQLEYNDCLYEMATSWAYGNLMNESTSTIEKIKAIGSKIWEFIKRICETVKKWAVSLGTKIKKLFTKNKENENKASTAISNINKQFNSFMSSGKDEPKNESVIITESDNYHDFGDSAEAMYKSDIPEDKKHIPTAVLNAKTIFGDKETRFIKKKFGDLTKTTKFVAHPSPILQNNHLVGIEVSFVNPAMVLSPKQFEDFYSNLCLLLDIYGDIDRYLKDKPYTPEENNRFIERDLINISKIKMDYKLHTPLNNGVDLTALYNKAKNGDLQACKDFLSNNLNPNNNSGSAGTSLIFGKCELSQILKACVDVYGDVYNRTIDIEKIGTKLNNIAKSWQQRAEKVINELSNAENRDITDTYMAYQHYANMPNYINKIVNFGMTVAQAYSKYYTNATIAMNNAAEIYYRAAKMSITGISGE